VNGCRTARGFEPTGSFSAELLAPAHLIQLESLCRAVNLPVRAPLAKKLIAVARAAKFGGARDADRHQRPRYLGTHARSAHTRRADWTPCWTARWNTSATSSDSRGRRDCGPSHTRCWSMAKDSSSSPTRTRERQHHGGHTCGVTALGTHRRGTGHRPCGEARTYRASKEELTLVASTQTADTRSSRSSPGTGVAHVQPAGRRRRPAPEAGTATEVAHCLSEHFSTPAIARYSSRELGTPNRLSSCSTTNTPSEACAGRG